MMPERADVREALLGRLLRARADLLKPRAEEPLLQLAAVDECAHTYRYLHLS